MNKGHQQAAHATLHRRSQRLNHLLMLVSLVNGVVVNATDVAVLGGRILLDFFEAPELQLRMRWSRTSTLPPHSAVCQNQGSLRFRAEKLRTAEQTRQHAITA